MGFNRSGLNLGSRGLEFTGLGAYKAWSIGLIGFRGLGIRLRIYSLGSSSSLILI